MIKIFNFISQLNNLVNYQSLIIEKKNITFYSENKNYWIYFAGIIKEILENYSINLCYISSDKNDPGLKIKNDKFKAFYIESEPIRNWLFQNMDTNILVMTMPDLNNFQIKKSKKNIYYVYIQHSMVSSHMIYRSRAFDNFDCIFCAGPHQFNEIRETEKIYELKKKNLIKHGYSRLDYLLKNKSLISNKKRSKHILIAPTWGQNGIIETQIIFNFIEEILKRYELTLRPHPVTFKKSKKIIEIIEKKYSGYKNFKLELDISLSKSLKTADLMISDWSGVALEYYFAYKKPVLFLDTIKKINNSEYSKVNLTPIEISIREKIGLIANPNNLNEIINKVERLLSNDHLSNENPHKYIYNIGKSDQVGAKELYNLFISKNTIIK